MRAIGVGRVWRLSEEAPICSVRRRDREASGVVCRGVCTALALAVPSLWLGVGRRLDEELALELSGPGEGEEERVRAGRTEVM